jgi:hypothetical protein
MYTFHTWISILISPAHIPLGELGTSPMLT